MWPFLYFHFIEVTRKFYLAYDHSACFIFKSDTIMISKLVAILKYKFCLIIMFVVSGAAKSELRWGNAELTNMLLKGI